MYLQNLIRIIAFCLSSPVFNGAVLMAKWNKGYYSKLPYPSQHLRETSPVYINFCLLRAGYLAPNSQNMSYCELGCGYAYNLILLAACYPEMTFYGVDFNPDHIAKAKKLINEAELKNIHLYDLDFASLDEIDLPQFDYIVLHKVWCSISSELQTDVLNIISKKLKNMGVVYVDYHSLPGAHQHTPLKKLYAELYEECSGVERERINTTRDLVDQIIKHDASYFQNVYSAKELHEENIKKNFSIFAHEYLSQNRNAYYFCDMAAQLNEAGLGFVSSVDLRSAGLNVEYSKNYHKVLTNISGNNLKEQIKDYAYNRSYRKDLFQRGAVALDELELEQSLYRTKVGIYGTRSTFSHQLRFDDRSTIEFDTLGHAELIHQLKRASQTIEELRNKPILCEMKYQDFLHMICCCIEAGQISLLRSPEDISLYSAESALRLNKAIINFSRSDATYQYLASPEFGCGLKCSPIDQLFLFAYHQGEDPVQFALEMVNEKKTILPEPFISSVSEEETRKMLKDAAEEFQSQKLEYLEKFTVAA